MFLKKNIFTNGVAPTNLGRKDSPYIRNTLTPFENVLDAVYFFGFYGISTLIGYLMPNPFLYK